MSGNDWNDPEAILSVLLASVYLPTLCEKMYYFFPKTTQKLVVFFCLFFTLCLYVH